MNKFASSLQAKIHLNWIRMVSFDKIIIEYQYFMHKLNHEKSIETRLGGVWSQVQILSPRH
jgi:hypothetical protein